MTKEKFSVADLGVGDDVMGQDTGNVSKIYHG